MSWSEPPLQAEKQRVASGANSILYSLDNAAGSLLVATIMFEVSTATVTSLVDTLGNVWVLIGTPIADVGANWASQVAYVKNALPGPNTVTLTPSIGASMLSLFEYSGGDTVAPLDDHKEAQGSGGTTADSGNLTTTATGDLLFAFITSNRSLTAGTGYVLRLTDAFNDYTMEEDQTAGVGGLYNATATLASVGSWTACLAAFKPASGGTVKRNSLTLLGVG